MRRSRWPVAFWGSIGNAMSDAGGVIYGPEQLGMWVIQ